MLKLFPIAGTILLTGIILYIVYRVIRDEKQKIADALAGRHSINPVEALIKAGVLDEDDPQVQAWRDYCDQPVGEPPLPIPNAAPAPRPAASEPESRPSLSRDSGSSVEVTSEEAVRLRDDFRRAHPEITAVWEAGDDGEPLPAAMAHQPNVGGEGNPAYEGPHYDVPHDRFVPYEVLGEPIPGTAVHLVGNIGVMGPLPEIDGDNNIREWKPDDEA